MKAVAYNLMKFNTIAFFAALLTFLLFYFMQYLIATSDDIQPEIFVTKIIDGRVPEFLIKPELIIEPPEIISKDESVPPEAPIPGHVGSGISIPTPQIINEPGIENFGPSIGMADNIMIPLVRTTATYPPRALARGIEGFVELSFTVNEFGDVIDAVVTYAEPEGVFDRSALQSISRWKYAAAVKEGIAVPTYDVRQRIVYKMNSEN